MRGLSPRTRGNRTTGRGKRRRVGSIPANAGEPPCRRTHPRRCWVYPRARGGTAAPTSLTATGWGLSPRTRGNPPSLLPWQGSPGSIPAHAGEPLNESLILTIHEVYPRARGGTMTLAYLLYLHWGLSPRTRGNLQSYALKLLCFGSIPAHAGEPRSRSAGQSP